MVNYTDSLDACLSVIKKIGKDFFLNFCRHDVDDYHISCFTSLDCCDGECVDEDDSIQYMVALSLYKAIIELEGDNDRDN